VCVCVCVSGTHPHPPTHTGILFRQEKKKTKKRCENIINSCSIFVSGLCHITHFSSTVFSIIKQSTGKRVSWWCWDFGISAGKGMFCGALCIIVDKNWRCWNVSLLRRAVCADKDISMVWCTRLHMYKAKYMYIHISIPMGFAVAQMG